MVIKNMFHDINLRKIIKEARYLTGIVQGTMGLEGQGLDGRALRQIKKRIIQRLLRS